MTNQYENPTQQLPASQGGGGNGEKTKWVVAGLLVLALGFIGVFVFFVRDGGGNVSQTTNLSPEEILAHQTRCFEAGLFYDEFGVCYNIDPTGLTPEERAQHVVQARADAGVPTPVITTPDPDATTTTVGVAVPTPADGTGGPTSPAPPTLPTTTGSTPPAAPTAGSAPVAPAAPTAGSAPVAAPTTAPAPTAAPTTAPAPTSVQVTCESCYQPNGSGTCITPKFSCAHPEVEFVGVGQQGCISHASCFGIGPGWGHQNGQCTLAEVTCSPGYSEGFGAAAGQCVTPNLFCTQPDVEFFGVGQSECLSPQQCLNIGPGWGHHNGQCTRAEVTCSPGYSEGFGAAAGQCVTPNLFCTQPNVEFFGVGQSECLSPQQCLNIGPGWGHQNGQCTGPP